MIVLGLHGWPSRSHDACACLIMDGEIVACAEEERFIRQRYAYDHAPIAAARWCLDRAGIQVDDLDAVAVGGAHSPSGRGGDVASVLQVLLPKDLFPRSRVPELVRVPHHLAHAASAFYPSGFESAAVLVVDGQGESSSVTIGHGTGGQVVILDQLTVAESLGYFYEAVCCYAGLRSHDAGKLMGLAAHGHPNDDWLRALHTSDDGYEIRLPSPQWSIQGDQQEAVMGMWLRYLEESLPLAPNRGGKRDVFDYRDLAASAQARLEGAMSGLVQRALALTGEDRIVLAGGVALNAKCNGLLYPRFGSTRMFVQPLANDAGTAVGAAMQVARDLGDEISPMDDRLSVGPAYSLSEMVGVLRELGLPFREVDDPHESAAELIGNGAIVAWFQARAEVGPRALGQRSILAPVGDIQSRDRVNLLVKEREWWRPLAPSLLREDSGKYLAIDDEFPHMVIASSLTDLGTRALAAAVHVDGTTRPQTVERGTSYGDLLEAVRRNTGHGAVLNTSFNGPGQPIVHTPMDACATFLERPLDALLMGNFVLEVGP